MPYLFTPDNAPGSKGGVRASVVGARIALTIGPDPQPILEKDGSVVNWGIKLYFEKHDRLVQI